MNGMDPRARWSGPAPESPPFAEGVRFTPMRDWQRLACLLHRRCVALREKLACELAISKRLSLAGTRVTAELQAERRKSQRLLRSSERKK